MISRMVLSTAEPSLLTAPLHETPWVGRWFREWINRSGGGSVCEMCNLRPGRPKHGDWLYSLLLLVLLSLGAVASPSGPEPPCGGPPRPLYPDLGAAPHTQVWSAADLPQSWVPLACLGWNASGFRTLVALAGRFQTGTGADDLLARFGAVSAMVGLRYWSATDRQWRELVTSAVALQGPDSRIARSDFTVAEMRSGRDLYFVQRDNRSSGDVIYRIQVRQASADRITVAMENVTDVRLFLLTLFPAGSLQTVYILERQSGDVWDYYSLGRTATSSSVFTAGFAASYANRATAVYRHIAKLPEDAIPPAAP